MDARTESHFIPPPHLGLALTEAHRAFAEFSSLLYTRRLLNRMPKGDGHGVVVLPGFLGDDGYNAPLRRYLGRLGYDAVGWAQGRNLGPRGDLLERALDYIREVAERTGGRVSLVGHSLGGIYARELAKEIPQQIRQVISLGSPFGEGRDTASYPGRLFYALNPREEVTLDQYVLTDHGGVLEGGWRGELADLLPARPI